MTVLEKDNAQEATFQLFDGCPTANAAVFLNYLMNRVLDDPLNPFIPNNDTIRSRPDRFKIGSRRESGNSGILPYYTRCELRKMRSGFQQRATQPIRVIHTVCG